jgi:hypothetical protein
MPAFAFAQSREVLIPIAAIGITMLGVSFIIAKLRWRRHGKILLQATYFTSILLTGMYFYNWPIAQFGNIITACLILIPIIVVFVNFILFNKYFKIEK